MSVFKCKMCGGSLEIIEGASIVECDYCGSKQTLPRFDSERKLNLYDRANHFRRNNEFDKAEGIYENILNEDPTDAEAYWSLVLCRYGIEYVEDPAAHKRVPTVNRAQYTSVFADENYKKAVENADDTLQRELYEAEAKAIDEIQRGILEISEKEDPFDVFICYKETDAQGRRTQDSVLANELYHELTNEGFKVFFSRITLEDKLGTAYEPYIFAALHSAKVMVVLGTKPEYFNAVWVKNEWSRYLALIRSGEKKTLIPAYRNMDPYDLPEEFSHLQAQDMSKLGFMPDLVRGIRKIVEAEKPKAASIMQQIVQQSAGGANLTAQLKRGMIALEDMDWIAAEGFFDKALDMDAECAEAYFGKALAAAQCASGEKLVQERITQAQPNGKELEACARDEKTINEAVERFSIPKYFPKEKVIGCFSFDNRTYTSYTEGWEDCIVQEKTYWEQTERNLSRALRYAKGETAKQYQSLRDNVIFVLKSKHSESKAADEKEKASVAQRYSREMETASQTVAGLYEAAIGKRAADYRTYCSLQSVAKTIDDYRLAGKNFESIGMRGYEDSDERARQCFAYAERLEAEAKAEKERLEAEKKAAAEAKAKADAEARDRERIAEEKSRKEKNKKIAIITSITTLVVIVILLVVMRVIVPGNNYKAAVALIDAENKSHAAIAFGKLGNYKDAKTRSYILWNEVAERETISAGGYHTVGLCFNGTVVAVGRNDDHQCDVSDWTDIIAVSTGNYQTVGLHSDGTVVAVGKNNDHQCDVSDWTDIVSVSAGNTHTVGLRSDGTVVAVGRNDDHQCDVSGWTDIVAVSAGNDFTVGLCSDGKVVAVGNIRDIRASVYGWTGTVMVSAGGRHAVGLRPGGTVVAAGQNNDGQCNVSSWTDIVAVSAGEAHTVGLHSDGTVVAVGYSGSGRCDVSSWIDTVAVSAGFVHTVGLRSNGTVVATGGNSQGQCNVSDWANIMSPNKRG